MFTTYRSKLNLRTITSSTLAIVLALSTTAALGRAMVGPGDNSEGDGNDESGGKAQACGFIGCPNGNRLCGAVNGKLGATVPPFNGEVSVSWTCYESGPSA